MRARTWLGVVLVAFGFSSVAQERIDFTDRITPTCELTGLVATPPAGWFNVPFDKLPEGHHGCTMLLTNENEEPTGILRIRSVTAPALDEAGETFEHLFESEIEGVASMGYIIDPDALWVRRDVPIKGEGFQDARGVGFAAKLEGNPIPQEVHVLVFRSDDAEYAISLLTPAKAAGSGYYDRNTTDFGTLIRTLKQKGK